MALGETSVNRLPLWLLLQTLCLPSVASGQLYVGAMGGLSTLSADARSVIRSEGASFWLYKPENGATATLFLGRHLTDCLSVQGDYGWSGNDLTLSSTSVSGQGETVYQEVRTSSQQSVVGNLLLYFRNRHSWVRPYLSVGTGLLRLQSKQVAIKAL